MATTHVFDPAFAPPPLTVETALLVGAVMRVFTAEASEQFPELAMALAIRALMETLSVEGLR